ncbi:s-s bond formation pathway protein [Pteropox virus]|uniref:S-s bond formation pathway protein n=1 Tax=Pteropox virus TaxID=1873698 RepID=A0A1B1MR96_9POXV|nr:s-s bond formation pathway protein [Pteropox virus]ANS71101.1 s-s bond formation pathway protein [Pteropox virus]
MAATKPVKTLYDMFADRYMELLAIYAVPTNITCAIHIGNISGTLNGCALKIINRCNNNTKLSYSLLTQAFLETISKLPINEQKKIADKVGIDLNLKPGETSKLEQQCSATASVTSIIDVQNLNIGTCVSPPGQHILIQFINTGSASANCGINTILQALVNNYEIPIIKPTISFNNPWIIALSVIITFIIIISVSSLRRRIKLAYKYGATLRV